MFSKVYPSIFYQRANRVIDFINAIIIGFLECRPHILLKVLNNSIKKKKTMNCRFLFLVKSIVTLIQCLLH